METLVFSEHVGCLAKKKKLASTVTESQFNITLLFVFLLNSLLSLLFTCHDATEALLFYFVLFQCLLNFM